MRKKGAKSGQALVLSVVVLVIVLGFSLLVATIFESGPRKPERIDALAESEDECVVCHREETPGILEQYGHSTMAHADVSCRDCHEVAVGYPGSAEHEGANVLAVPSTARCQQCHEREVEQYYNSRHALPSYVAYAGTSGLTPEQRKRYDSIPEAQFQPNRSRNALHKLEGEAITKFACETCHDIGKPHVDGSVGDCTKCHLRHDFSIVQARKPETCNACHIGPDHPQWEIYQESPHGIAYQTMSDNWNWEAEAGTIDTKDFPAPTCSTCHFGSFGESETTHDAGDRLSWFLFEPQTKRRPGWEENAAKMKQVCSECHNDQFVKTFYTDADAAVARVNEWVVESDEIRDRMKEAGHLTPEPFDQPFDYEHFELWHHWGRTAKFGTWMQGPDYVQWHGAYEVLKSMAHLKEMEHEAFKDAAAPTTKPTHQPSEEGSPTQPAPAQVNPQVND